MIEQFNSPNVSEHYPIEEGDDEANKSFANKKEQIQFFAL
jgi:hypothetical protein